jgi:hypothetical protein
VLDPVPVGIADTGGSELRTFAGIEGIDAGLPPTIPEGVDPANIDSA